MSIPSFEHDWQNGKRGKPRIQVLEVRPVAQPDDEPIEWIVVERRELYELDPRDQSVYSASIRLSYQRTVEKYSRGVGGGTFDGSYSSLFGTVSLTSRTTSSGGVFIDPEDLRGLRIGTYLMNEIVQWAQQWPEATVQSIELRPGQADESNRERRNRFYERFGIVFDYADSEHACGRSRPMLVRQLTPADSWKKNITEQPVMEYLANLLYAHKKTSWELRARDRAHQNLIDQQRHVEQHPVKWVVTNLYYRYSSRLIGSAVIAALLGIAWLKLKT